MDPSEMIVEEYLEENENKTSTVCDVCGKEFVNIYTLKQHKKVIHENLKEFYCEHCLTPFATSYKLKRHIQAVHGSKRDEYCEICGASFKTKESLNKHSRTHYKGPFECPLCNLEFKYKSGLDHHIKLKHTEKPKKEKSKKRKKKVEELPFDEFIEVDVPNEPEPEEQPDIVIAEIVPDKGDVICDTCGKFFKTRNELKRHFARKHGDGSDFKFSCAHCDKKFLILYELQRHMSVHLSERAFECNQCGNKFKTKASLSGHVKTIHCDDKDKEKKFQCSLCSTSFFYERHLKYHMWKHTNERKYHCKVEDCQKSFFNSDALKWHKIRIHNEPAPFNCFICERKFIHKKVAENHENEHGEDGSLAVSCPVCDKKISEKRHLKRHMRIHLEKSFECQFCMKTFKENHMLTRHLDTCEYRTEFIQVDKEEVYCEDE